MWWDPLLGTVINIRICSLVGKMKGLTGPLSYFAGKVCVCCVCVCCVCVRVCCVCVCVCGVARSSVLWEHLGS